MSTIPTTRQQTPEAVPARADLSAPRRPDWYAPLLDRGLLPDGLLRFAIRKRLLRKLAEMRAGGIEAQHERFRTFLDDLDQAPIAELPRSANEQHYELPPAFFELTLGKHLKYSCCLWDEGVTSLDEAEQAMLELTCERARLADGETILELGCGWGSLSLFMAARYPNARITAISNSKPQREFIMARAAERGLSNLEVITCDMNDLDDARLGNRRFDRAVSIEMFEHMKNYRRLLANIAGWLEPGGTLFVHIFTHREQAYHFMPTGDWFGEHFFTGGTMPSDFLLHHYQQDLALIDHWRIDGRHYEKTADAWLANHDRHAHKVRAVMRQTYGEAGDAWFHRWRVFWIGCAALWGLKGGSEYLVSHYLFERNVQIR